MDTFSKKLRDLRIEHQMTQEELSSKVGVARSTLASWEIGRREPDYETAIRLAQILGVKVDYLLGNESIIESLPVGAFVPDRLVHVPIYGEIRAGYPMLVQEEIIGYQYEPAEDIRGGEYFYLRVKGDSMIGAGIRQGDIVLVRRQDVLDNGQIGVVMVGNEEATLKRVYRRGNQYVLVAENPAYEPQVYPAKEVKIIGETIKVERWLNGRK